MAKFLTTDGISSEITNIIKNARSQVTLITPYLKVSNILFERLKDADRQSKKINLVYGKDELKPDEKGKLQQLDNLSLHFSKDLHAKCYYNEECMVIASMNLHEYSQQHNKEMGVLLSLKEDYYVFNEALTEAKFILNGAEKYSLIRSVLSKAVKASKSRVAPTVKDELRRPGGKPYSYRTKQPGYCIRCKRRIPYELDYPLCDECFEVWSQYGDLDYPEHYCHTCGKRASTSKARPECDSCYKPRR